MPDEPRPQALATYQGVGDRCESSGGFVMGRVAVEAARERRVFEAHRQQPSCSPVRFADAWRAPAHTTSSGRGGPPATLGIWKKQE